MSLHFRSLFLSIVAVTTTQEVLFTDGYILCPIEVYVCDEYDPVFPGHTDLLKQPGVLWHHGWPDNVCAVWSQTESERCTSGDAFSINDECHFCCSDLEDCRRQMEFVQEGINSNNEVLHCPTCSVATKDPMDCFRNLQPCDPNVKVCSVEWTGNEVTGGCEKNLLLCRLHESQSWGHCGQDSSQHNSFCARCCDSSQCLLDAFHINTTTAAASTTSGLTTTTTDAVTTTQVVSCSGMFTFWPTSTTTATTEFETTTETSTTTTTLMTTTTAETTTTSTITTTTETTTTPTTTITTTETTTTPTTTITTPIITTPTPTQTTTTLATTTTPATTQRLCTDSSSIDCTIPGLCDVSFGKVYCPRTCKSCESAELTTPSPICEDNLIDTVFKCIHLPDICSQEYAHMLCPRTCGYCS